MKSEKIMTARGEVVAIGEFKVRNSREFPYEIPRLSYIIVQEDSGNVFASTCIDLHVDGEGSTLNEAEADMWENVYNFLRLNFADNRAEGPAWDYLNELFTVDENTKDIWNAYTNFKLDLAKKGIKTDMASKLLVKLSEKTKEIEKLTKHIQAKEKEIKTLRTVNKKQKEEIELLNKDKQKLQVYTKELLKFTASQSIKQKYFEYIFNLYGIMQEK